MVKPERAGKITIGGAVEAVHQEHGAPGVLRRKIQPREFQTVEGGYGHPLGGLGVEPVQLGVYDIGVFPPHPAVRCADALRRYAPDTDDRDAKQHGGDDGQNGYERQGGDDEYFEHCFPPFRGDLYRVYTGNRVWAIKNAVWNTIRHFLSNERYAYLSSSKMPAAPMPPPMHMVTRAYLPAVSGSCR